MTGGGRVWRSGRVRRAGWTVGVLLGLAMAVAACAPTTAIAPTAPPTAQSAPPTAAPAGGTKTVKLGASNAGASNGPIYVADAMGYFADQGIALDEVFFPSASEVIPALSKGDVDAAVVGINPATLNALAGNFNLHLVADGGSQPTGYPVNVFVVAKEVAGAIHGPADLRGRKIATTPPGPGTASGFMLSR